MAWAPDGQRVAAASADGCIWLFDANSGQVTTIIEGHEDFVEAVAWSPDSTRLASGSGRTLQDRSVRIWDASSGKSLLTSEPLNQKARLGT